MRQMSVYLATKPEIEKDLGPLLIWMAWIYRMGQDK
jgi:hypothetical protein